MRRFTTILLLLVGITSGHVLAQPAADTVTTTQQIDTVKVVQVVDTVKAPRETQAADTTNIAEEAGNDIKKQMPKLRELISFGKIFWTAVFLIAGYFILNFLGKILERFAERSTNYRIAIKGFIPVVKIFGWIFVLFVIIAGIFQPPVETVIAVTASVGIAVGFAAQDILKNIFGGIMILFDRPFQVGDKIETGDYYGEVVQIGLRSTRIVTADDSLVSIPNGELMNKSVSNSNSGEANCQVVAEIYLPITIDTEKVRKVALETAQVSRFVYLNKPITVLFFNEIKERRSYLKMRLKAYVSDIRNEFAFKSDMTEIVTRELIKNKLLDPEEVK